MDHTGFYGRALKGARAENVAMGPVVNEGAMKSILNYIEVGKKEGRLVTGGGRASEAGDGYFIVPRKRVDDPDRGVVDRRKTLAEFDQRF